MRRSELAAAESTGGGMPVTAMPRSSVSGAERAAISQAFARLDVFALACAVGLVAGLGLSLATFALLAKGGQDVGLHLSRLGYFLPGYSVSWMGVFLGFFQGGAIGFALGALLATMWNLYHNVFVAFLIARDRSREMRRELQEL